LEYSLKKPHGYWDSRKYQRNGACRFLNNKCSLLCMNQTWILELFRDYPES
jgi:hypothetical protein